MLLQSVKMEIYCTWKTVLLSSRQYCGSAEAEVWDSDLTPGPFDKVLAVNSPEVSSVRNCYESYQNYFPSLTPDSVSVEGRFLKQF